MKNCSRLKKMGIYLRILHKKKTLGRIKEILVKWKGYQTKFDFRVKEEDCEDLEW